MAASPSSGERPPIQGAFRRSFTVPARQLSVHEKAGLDKADAGADILYTHASARIVSFSPPTDSIKSNSKAEIPADTDYPVDTIETLPWRSRSETLAASGVLVIEKVRGSTNFLKCQNVMHAILRNSQCWCVDGESKFVLRVRSFKYYRIELPSKTEEDKAKVEELKKVLPTVLRYERTPCPFIRAFTVDLPDDAITPRRKGQWKRRDSSQSNTPDTETPPLRRTKVTRSWSTRNPPTSYPKSGPGSSFEFDRGRPIDSSHLLFRRSSLFESSRNSSPGSYVPSDEGTDSEHQGSEHDSDVGGNIDRSESASPQKGGRSKLAGEISQTSTLSPSDTKPGYGTTFEAQANSDDKDTKPDRPVRRRERKALMVDGPAPDNDAEPSQSERDMNEGEAIDDMVPLIASKEAKNAAVVAVDDAVVERAHGLEPQPTKAQSDEISNNLTNSKVRADFESSAPADSQFQSSELSLSSELMPLTANAEARQERILNEDPVDFEDQSSTHKHDSPSAEVGSSTPAVLPTLETPAKLIFGTSIKTEDEGKPKTIALQPSPSLLERNVKLVSTDLDEDDVLIVPGKLTESMGSGVSDGRTAPHIMPTEPVGIEPTRNVSSVDIVSEDEALEDDDVLSTVSSVDSFHTMASPKYERSQSDLDVMRSSAATHRALFPSMASQHKRDLSDVTVTASSVSDPASPGHGLHSVRSEGSREMSSTPVPDDGGIHQRSSRQRAYSPLPPPSTIFLGNQIRHDSGSGHMTKAILQKIIVKPIEVAILFVHILARIAGGATVNDLMSGDLFKRPHHTRRVSGFADQLNGDRSNSDTEDDYGVPIRGRRRSTERRLAMVLDEDNDQNSEGVD